MLIICLFLLVFGILGVQLWKGGVSSCNNDDPLIRVRGDCVGLFTQDTYNEVGIKNGTETIEMEWQTPFNNYNNVLFSMITFFEISTLEMWPDMMFDAIDSDGVDNVKIRNNNLMIALIFVVYIFLTTFFVMNLFISVIVDKFTIEIKKR